MQKRLNCGAVPHAGKRTLKRTRGFRAVSAVMVDTLANRTYSLDLEKAKERAEKVKKENPKLYRRTALATRYGFWLVFPVVERAISKVTGSIISCGLVYSNPLVVSYLVKAYRHRFKGDGNDNGLMSKPALPAYIGTVAVITTVSFPSLIYLIDRIAERLTNGPVTPLVALVSVTVASTVAVGIELLSLYQAWKRIVLRKMENRGTFKDGLNGFIKEFKPFSLLSKKKKESAPAESAAEYAGQLCGIVEKHYFWIRSIRIAFAAGVAGVLTVAATAFASTLLTAMTAVGFFAFAAAITARYYENVSDRMDSNNKHLKL